MADVWEPWTPEVGDYVRVEVGPECLAWHSQRGGPRVAYGRIEIVDRAWDAPEKWVEHCAGMACGDSFITEDEARADAAVHIGHYYLVQDCLGRERVTWLDGYYCAAELTKVTMVTAVEHVIKARIEKGRLSPDERLFRALMGANS